MMCIEPPHVEAEQGSSEYPIEPESACVAR